MSGRWEYKFAEFNRKFTGSFNLDDMQSELNKLGTQGWELINIVPQLGSMSSMVVVLKREA